MVYKNALEDNSYIIMASYDIIVYNYYICEQQSVC